MHNTPPPSLYHCPALPEYSLWKEDSSKAEEWAEHLVGHGFPFSFSSWSVITHCLLLPFPHHPTRVSRTPVSELVWMKLWFWGFTPELKTCPFWKVGWRRCTFNWHPEGHWSEKPWLPASWSQFCFAFHSSGSVFFQFTVTASQKCWPLGWGGGSVGSVLAVWVWGSGFGSPGPR